MAMATHENVRLFQREATCTICHRFFTKPVSIMCGHIFCQECIMQEWKCNKGQCTCPKCGKRFKGSMNFWPNKLVAELADLAREFKPEHADCWRMCQAHREVFKFFCQCDRVPICPVCRVSKEHCMHPCITIEEAVMDYKAKFRVQMDHLKRKKDEMLQLKAAFDKKMKDLERKAAEEHQRVEAEFGRQQVLLEDEKQIILFQIKKEEKDWKQKLDNNINKVSSQTHSLEMVMAEIEEKNAEKGAQLLSGVDCILHRCENIMCEKPKMICPEIKKYICHFPPRTPFVEELTDDRTSKGAFCAACAGGETCPDKEKHRFSLNADNDRESCSSTGSSVGSMSPDCTQLQPTEIDSDAHEPHQCREKNHETPEWSHGDMWENESVAYFENLAAVSEVSPVDQQVRHTKECTAVHECMTLDPMTAHPSIIISEDLRSATRVATESQMYDEWRHCDTCACVLGSKGFTQGIHSWDVEVGSALSSWAVGVALESVKCKEPVGLFPKEGVWVLEMEHGYLQANTEPQSYLPSNCSLSRITVCLNCDAGRITFCNTETNMHIHTFHTPGFTEAVFPFFCLSTEGVHFRLSP
ncbi:E3 ubiquitin-protein ligase TRIM17-like isoform X2 [Ambystoma mexicanum]